MNRDLAYMRFTLLLFLLPLLAVAAEVGAQIRAEGELDQLTLKQAETLMHVHNRDIRSAQRASDSADADLLIAGQQPNPTLSLDAHNINPAQGIGSGSWRNKNVDKTIRLEQTLERGGKRELRLEQAGHNVVASREELVNTLRQQRLALRNDYYDLLLAQERLEILRDIAGFSARNQIAAGHRLAAGDIAKAEASRIRIDGLRSANDARQAEAELARARFALAALIGAETRSMMIHAADPWPDPVMPASASGLDDSIDRRPDVRAAQARFAAAQTGRRLAQSARSRDVTVGVQYEQYPVNSDFAVGNGSTYGFSLSVPLLLWHENQGEIRKAEVERFAAQDNLEKTRAVARMEMDRAWSDLTEAGERTRRFQGGLLDDAKAAAEAVEFAYRQGAVGVTDLLDANRTLRATQIEAAAARNDYAKALAAWQFSIGEEASPAPTASQPTQDSTR